MAGLGIEPETPATLARSSTPELPRPIFTVHIAPTTTYVKGNTRIEHFSFCYTFMIKNSIYKRTITGA